MHPESFRRHDSETAFRQSVLAVAGQTGFSARLIEKDYFCSLCLLDLAPLFETAGLVFKGGTCLSKVHANFYRLSEDLDFAISCSCDASPAMRRQAMQPVHAHLAELSTRQPSIRPLRSGARSLVGHHGSRQYTGDFTYMSRVTGQSEPLRIEISLREPIIEEAERQQARTALLGGITAAPDAVPAPSIPVRTLSLREAYAEKIRAALTRSEPAIRDFYDIGFAIRRDVLDFADSRLLNLVRRKLTVPGTSSPNLGSERRRALERQLETQLREVLREPDYRAFDLGAVFASLGAVERILGSPRFHDIS